MRGGSQIRTAKYLRAKMKTYHCASFQSVSSNRSRDDSAYTKYVTKGPGVPKRKSELESPLRKETEKGLLGKQWMEAMTYQDKTAPSTAR